MFSPLWPTVHTVIRYQTTSFAPCMFHRQDNGTTEKFGVTSAATVLMLVARSTDATTQRLRVVRQSA